RAATKRCERFETPGTWLGAMPSVTSATVDSEILLARGDVVVLYTDGLIETRDARREPFGVDRLCAEIETLAAGKPEPTAAHMSGVLLSRALMWGVGQDDDVSLVVMRYRGNAVFLPRSTTMTMNPLKKP